MNTLGSLAQNIQDFYLQDYAQGSEFFQEYHYLYLASTIYSSILDDEFKRSYAKNLSEVGSGFPDINPEWFIPEEVAILKNKGGAYISKLSSDVFSFKFDRQASGLGEIIPVSSNCRQFMKIASGQNWSIDLLPTTSITWYRLLSKNEVEFSRSSCKDESVLINYLPALDPKTDPEKQYVSEGLEKTIIEQAIAWLKGFGQGTVIDMSNNGNPNKVIETEIDQSFRNKRA